MLDAAVAALDALDEAEAAEAETPVELPTPEAADRT